MDLSKLDLSALALIYSKSTEENSASNDMIRELLLERIKTNTKYSKESIVQSLGNAISVYFIPESECFHKYGEYVTIIDIEKSSEDFALTLKNIVDNVPSYGKVNLTGRRPTSTINEDMVIDTHDILNIEP